MTLSRESPSRRTERRPIGIANGCTGFRSDCLHPASSFHYWPFRGSSLELIEVKGRRFIIRSLQTIKKAIGSDGVSASSTTSAQARKLRRGSSDDTKAGGNHGRAP